MAAQSQVAWPGWRLMRCLPAVLLCVAVPMASRSQPSLSPALKAADAAHWVETIQHAAEQRSYSGTLVYTAADQVSSSRLARYVTGGQVWEHLESLDGPQQRVYRHNDSLHTIWPERRVVTVERFDALGETLGMPSLDPRLQNHYEMRMLGSERVAGREASVLSLKPRDEMRFAQRLWADRATGLLLRTDVMSATGKVLESTTFSNIEIDVRLTRDQMLNPAKRLEGFRQVQVLHEATSLDVEGWAMERIPDGFRLLGCVKRPMNHLQASPAEKPVRALQVVYSDGLARVSLFVEPVDPAHPRQPLSTYVGATHTLMKARDNRWWITVMGDVPVVTLKAFADALLRKP